LSDGNFWDRNCGIAFGRNESAIQYDRFQAYLNLPHPRRLTTLAARLGISEPVMSVTARKYNWKQRAQAYDQRSEDYVGPPNRHNPLVVERPKVLDAEPYVKPPRGSSLRQQEKYRDAMLSLGRQQLEACLHLTEGFKRLSVYTVRLVDRVVAFGDQDLTQLPLGEMAQYAKTDAILSNQLTVAAQTLQRLSAAATQMGTLGRENWGQAVGVAAMLERFEVLLAQGEGMGYAEMQPAAIACATDPQQPPEEDEE
jgi:hypothetical protein